MVCSRPPLASFAHVLPTSANYNRKEVQRAGDSESNMASCWQSSDKTSLTTYSLCEMLIPSSRLIFHSGPFGRCPQPLHSGSTCTESQGKWTELQNQQPWSSGPQACPCTRHPHRVRDPGSPQPGALDSMLHGSALLKGLRSPLSGASSRSRTCSQALETRPALP